MLGWVFAFGPPSTLFPHAAGVATTFQVSEILADVARLANVPPFSGTTNVTTSQATYWLVQSARSLSALLRQKLGEDLDLLQSATLTTVPDFNLVSLPSDCGEVHSVLWMKDTTDYRLLQRTQAEDLEMGDTPDQAWECAPKFRLEGNTIALYPSSTAAENLMVFYTTHTNLSGETDFQGRLDFDRWVTLDVVCKVLAAKSRDNSIFLQDKMLLEKEMFSQARKREPNRTNTIRDVRGAAYQHWVRTRRY